MIEHLHDKGTTKILAALRRAGSDPGKARACRASRKRDIELLEAALLEAARAMARACPGLFDCAIAASVIYPEGPGSPRIEWRADYPGDSLPASHRGAESGALAAFDAIEAAIYARAPRIHSDGSGRSMPGRGEMIYLGTCAAKLFSHIREACPEIYSAEIGLELKASAPIGDRFRVEVAKYSVAIGIGGSSLLGEGEWLGPALASALASVLALRS